MPNQELTEELHKQVIRKFEMRKAHSSLIDNIWGVHLVAMQLLRKFSKGFGFLLCVIDVYNKYGMVAL